MFPMQPNHRLELNVENFGPIAKASIQLRPFTVLVGPSNTGKSYFAKLLYSLQRVLGLGPGGYPNRRVPGLVPNESLEREELASISATACDWILDTADHRPDDATPTEAVIPPNLATNLRLLIETQEDYPLRFELEDNFVVEELRELIRHKHKGHARIELSAWPTSKSDDARCWFRYVCARENSELTANVPESLDLSLSSHEIDLTRVVLERDPQDSRRRIHSLRRLAGLVQAHTLGALQHPVHYIPSGRTGLMHAQHAVMGSLIDQDRHGPHARDSFRLLSGTSRAFLGDMLYFGDRQSRRLRQSLSATYERIEQHTDAIEERVLEGSLTVTDSPVRLRQIRYRPRHSRQSMALARTSAMVSELAALILYLRYKVSQGDTIIVEEPESHLHPAAQVNLMRGLARLVADGSVRILITTHSEWMLECLANIVGSSDSAEGVAGILSEEDVGAWLFRTNRRPAGTVVQEIPLDRESGTYAAGYDDVARSLYNEWAAGRSER